MGSNIPSDWLTKKKKKIQPAGKGETDLIQTVLTHPPPPPTGKGETDPIQTVLTPPPPIQPKRWGGPDLIQTEPTPHLN